tara:strand:- start:2002 stop:2688 length:687 start_codon:yes stop_codon:yes gene_type:complete
VALAGLHAYKLKPDVKTILSLRPTEPLLQRAIKYAKKYGVLKAEQHITSAEQAIERLAFRKVKKKMFAVHSNTVMAALTYAHGRGKKIEVYCTETRPVYQGRTLAMHLAKHKIKVTQYVDLAIWIAIKQSQVVFLGADAILKRGKKIKGVVNKIGSYNIGMLAKQFKKPVYILADSWKAVSSIPIEQRDPKEVWDTEIKSIKIENPAFDVLPAKYITAIITEEGIHKL